jgi:hypothetical protein
MRTIIKKTATIAFFVTILVINLSIINGSNRYPILINLSIKTIIQTAIADGEGGGEACVFTNFALDAVQSSEIILCFNECNELCGLQKCCFYEEGAGICQETICQF